MRSGALVPGRITIIGGENDAGDLVEPTIDASRRLAVRKCVVYTANGVVEATLDELERYRKSRTERAPSSHFSSALPQ
jgi:hypothetical protein